MIHDNIKNAARYSGIGFLAQALGLAQKFSDPALETGAYPVDDGLRAVVNRYVTAEFERGKFENHHDFIDVQYLIEGEERILVAPAEGKVTKEYDADADYELFDSEKWSTLVMRPGDFAVLAPGEAHYPGLAPEGSAPAPVRKIVFKVKVGVDAK